MKHPILIPAGTVFVSSACVMTIELVAGRLIARHLGFSLYTWTSVIGVVLAGITIGNYLGGRIADRFAARKALSTVFAASSVACVAIVVLNTFVPRLELLWQFGLVFRIFSTVTLIFLLPSTLLGMISPIVAKMALDRGLPVGRTIGDIYAWGAAGSIAGTFIAGFYLIGAIGTVAIVWIVSCCMLCMAILYWKRLWLLYIWAAILLALAIFGNSPASWASDIGSDLQLRDRPDPSIIYQDESQYCYIAVKQVSTDPDTRLFIEDTDRHSQIVMGHPEDLQFNYFRMYAIATRQVAGPRKTLSTLTFGGGGCAFPRYVEKFWPQSRIDVIEIDPQVIEAAVKAFGLRQDAGININIADARQWLAGAGKSPQLEKYDIVYGDAFNGSTVPFQLVTAEFDEKVAGILNDDGAYIMNVIDSFDNGLFIGSVLNTLSHAFPSLQVMSADTRPESARNFVVVASRRPFDLSGGMENTDDSKGLRLLDAAEIATLKAKAKGMVLTDDYAPVDELLAPLAVAVEMRKEVNRYIEQASALRDKKEFDKSISLFRKAARLYPPATPAAYDAVGSMLVEQGRFQDAVDAGLTLVRYYDESDSRDAIPGIYSGIASLLKRMGPSEQTLASYDEVIRQSDETLSADPGNQGLKDWRASLVRERQELAAALRTK
jgi:spermidine synthase